MKIKELYIIIKWNLPLKCKDGSKWGKSMQSTTFIEERTVNTWSFQMTERGGEKHLRKLNTNGSSTCSVHTQQWAASLVLYFHVWCGHICHIYFPCFQCHSKRHQIRCHETILSHRVLVTSGLNSSLSSIHNNVYMWDKVLSSFFECERQFFL